MALSANWLLSSAVGLSAALVQARRLGVHIGANGHPTNGFGLGPVLGPVLGPGPWPGSGPPGQEAGYGLLEHLVADRGHMVAPGNLERPAGRQQARQLRRRAADHILGSERDQRRDPDGG